MDLLTASTAYFYGLTSVLERPLSRLILTIVNQVTLSILDMLVTIVTVTSLPLHNDTDIDTDTDIDSDTSQNRHKHTIAAHMDFLLKDNSFQDYGIELARKAGSEIKTFATEELLRQWTDNVDDSVAPPAPKPNSPLVMPFILLIKATFLVRDMAVFITNTIYVALVLPLDMSLVFLHFMASGMAGNTPQFSNILPLHLSRDVLWSGVPVSTGRGCRELTLPPSLVTVDSQGGQVIRDNSRSRVRFPSSGLMGALTRFFRRVPFFSRAFPQVQRVESTPSVDFHTAMGSLNDALNSQLIHRAAPVVVQKSNYSSL